MSKVSPPELARAAKTVLDSQILTDLQREALNTLHNARHEPEPEQEQMLRRYYALLWANERLTMLLEALADGTGTDA